MVTKEELLQKFQELEQQKNSIITEQLKIQGKLELLDEQERSAKAE